MKPKVVQVLIFLIGLGLGALGASGVWKKMRLAYEPEPSAPASDTPEGGGQRSAR